MNVRKNEGIAKWLIIGISSLFLVVMLILPLIYVMVTAFEEGIQAFWDSVSDEYAVKAILLTVEVALITVVINTLFGVFAAWCITKFSFKGKKVVSTLIDLPLTVSPIIAGLIYVLTFGRQSVLYEYLDQGGIQIIFAVPGIVLATIFVTFPFISREIIPVLTAQGTDEEEAAALMGADGLTIFRKITFPHIKWALLYGIVLCTARAMGEFGAVSVLSGHLSGKTNTLPFHIESIFNEFQYVPAFAVSSILVMLAIAILIIRSIVVNRGNKQVNKLHKETSSLVQASAQSLMMRTMQEHLTEEETAVYKRGRNAKSISPAKNQSITDYRRATGFEALLGYLYLKKEWKRMLDLVKIGLDSLKAEK